MSITENYVNTYSPIIAGFLVNKIVKLYKEFFESL